MMNQATWQRLEYDKVKDMLLSYTVSPAGSALASKLKPSSERRQVQAWLIETEEAAALLNAGASVPLSAMEGIEPFLQLLGKGRIYVESELDQLASWLAAVAQMRRYMDSKRETAPTIAGYASAMDDCPELREELARCIRYGQLTDGASPRLSSIRRHIYAVEDKIHKKLEHTLSKYKSALQEPIISKRRGRSVIAVKRELRKQVPGTVWDESASGQTLFVEPADVAELQHELQEWHAEEERERTIILSELSELAELHNASLRLNLEAMAAFDFIMARGKLGTAMNGRAAELLDVPAVRLVEARHPLLGPNAVPLTLELGFAFKQLMITGPNTGGKTVTLKTIGLLALMVQSGLLIPAGSGSGIGLFQHIEADLGDGQSLEQSLSTFSSHISVLKEMLKHAGSRSLLLLDELAAGTDPGEGIALSIAVLEELLHRGSLTAATTHFNEIKTFASRTPGCSNARMAFDAETLKPEYRLVMGEAGDSHAFAIARRYGLPEQVMRRAEVLLVERTVSGGSEEATRGDASLTSSLGTPSYGSIEGGRQQEQQSLGERPRTRRNVDHTKEAKKPLESGDNVWIYPLKRTGIVYRPADERGEVIVQVEGKKLTFNQKRLRLYIAKDQLYPGENYDMDIVFDTKENRKARKQLSRKHVEGLTIITPPDDGTKL
ncbi:DNA mismatch repair protein MutS [Paenibacillus sp. GCM10023252]|uniref:endonuclease MutS2 n=1 Tax=Paenibacillus sp. GCM10023252 TaxID=3252649 RepID=UPI00360E30FF